MPRLIVVFGAGGGTGLAAVHHCAALGHAVRAVVRSPEAHAGRMPAGAELVAGDVTDAASVAAALVGAHGAIFAASTSYYLSADAVDHQGVRVVAEAAKAVGVCRVALVSSAFVSPHQYWSPIRLILNAVKYRLMDAKFDGEQALRRSGVSYTVIRPGRLADDAGGDAAWHVGQGDRMSSGGAIARADVAAVAIAALFDDAADGVTLEICGLRPAAPPAEGQLAALFRGLQRDEPVAAL